MRAAGAAGRLAAMTTRSLASLTAALLAAAVPAAADAAVKTGTYNTYALTDASGAELDGTSFGVTVDRGKVTSLSITWLCRGDGDPLERDRETIVVAHADDKAVFAVKRDKLRWRGTARTLSGDLLSDPPRFEEGKAKVKVAGAWKGSTLTGTFSATMGDCASGSLSYTAKRA